MTALKHKLIQYLATKKTNSNSAFTLVELIVVVVIIGILSSIAIPSFQNASDKAKQKEPATLLASYVKAAQAYFTEYSMNASYSRDLGQYISVTGCRNNNPSYCKTQAAYDHTNRTSRSWYSPSGYFQIYMQPSGTRTYFRALPTGQYSNAGYGVSACYNSQTGATKVVERTTKGRSVPNINC